MCTCNHMFWFWHHMTGQQLSIMLSYSSYEALVCLTFYSSFFSLLSMSSWLDGRRQYLNLAKCKDRNVQRVNEACSRQMGPNWSRRTCQFYCEDRQQYVAGWIWNGECCRIGSFCFLCFWIAPSPFSMSYTFSTGGTFVQVDPGAICIRIWCNVPVLGWAFANFLV